MKWSYGSLLTLFILLAGVILFHTDGWCENGGTRSLSLRIGTSELPGLPIDNIGISAYANIGQLEAYDLTTATKSFESTSIDKGTDYVSGNIRVINNDNGVSADVFVYINLNGWIISSLEKSLPVSKIIMWQEETGYNALEEAIKLLMVNVPDIGFSTVENDILYYDFEYPEANAIMVIKDWAEYGSTKTSGSYTMTVPADIQLYDIAFCLTYVNSSYSDGHGEMYFNNNLVLFTNNDDHVAITKYESISTNQINADTSYLVNTEAFDRGTTRTAIVIIYQK
jgi:hypothetical protein